MWLFLFPDLSSLPEGPWASCSSLCLGFPISEMGAMPSLGLLEEYMKLVCVLGAYMSHSVTGWHHTSPGPPLALFWTLSLDGRPPLSANSTLMGLPSEHLNCACFLMQSPNSAVKP